MTDPAILRDLLERIEAATGPDRELDYLIANSIGDWGPVDDPFPLTASIDAALALVEKMLPGCLWEVNGGDPQALSRPLATIWPASNNTVQLEIKARGNTPQHAILSALIRALLASPGGAR